MTDRAESRKPAGSRRGGTLAVGLAVGTITLAGAALRFWGLSARDFWFDESCTFIYVHNLFHWPAGSNLLVESTNLPYYVLLRGWTAMFGESEAAFRSLSALAATLTIPVLGLAAYRLMGRTAAVVCAVIAALHPLHIYYAHEARAYALWALALSVCLLLLIEAAKRNTWRWWCGFGITLGACLYVHYFTAFWAAASVFGAGLAADRRRALRRWLATVCVVALGFLPYFLFAVMPAAQGGGSRWIAESFDPLTALPRTLWALLPAGAYPGHLRGLSLDSPDKSVVQPAIVIVASQVIPAIVVVLLALLLLRRRNVETSNRRTYETKAGSSTSIGFGSAGHLAVAGLTLGPLILAWGYSVAVRPVYLVGRYDLVAWPAAVIWLAAAVASFARGPSGREQRTAAVIVAALLLPTLAPIHRILAFRPPPSRHHLRAERVADLTGPGDLVIAFSYDRDHLAYYLHRARFAGTIRSFPTWLEKQVGWVDTPADRSPTRMGLAARDAEALARLVGEAIRSNRRVIVAADSLDPQGAGERGELHRLLIEALGAMNLAVRLRDPELLLWEVADDVDGPGPDSN